MTLQTADLPLVLPQNGECEPCAERIRQSLAATKGIRTVAVDSARSRLTVQYDADLLPLARVQTLVADAGAMLAQTIRHETLTLTGLDCADCATTLERGVRRLPGVLNVSANFAGAKMNVEYTAGAVGHDLIVQRIRELGYGVTAPRTAPPAPDGAVPLLFDVTGMDCADCVTTIERQVARVPGVQATQVNLMAGKMEVRAAGPDAALVGRIQQAVRDVGYSATVAGADIPAVPPAEPFWRRHAHLLPTAAAAALWGLAFVLEQVAASVLLIDALYAVAILVGGYRIARSGLAALIRGRTLGIDLLMTIAVVGAALIGEWAEGAAVVVLFSLGEALEGLTVDKARDAIRSLMDLSPPTAVVKDAAGERAVPVAQLLPGDIVVVRPGERVAADGRVAHGSTTINQAPITGESLPVAKEVGDEVYAGTVNERGYIEVAVTKRAQDTTLAKIIDLVEKAQGSKAPSQRFVDQFAKYYTPAVIVGAVLVAALPPLLGQPFLPWLYKALVLLVIACPCALVISTPVAIVAGIGRASRSGVLIKGGAYLEAMGGVQALAVDKTGTLTEGRPAVTDVLPLAGQSVAEVLTLAAAVESQSEHPLAGAVLRAAQEQGLRPAQPRDFEALTGRGAQARVAGELVVVGNLSLFPTADEAVQARVAALQAEGKTVLLVGRAAVPEGLIAVADQLRPGVARVVARLRDAGVRAIVMLTGDNERTAQAVARRVGITAVRANLLPEHKTTAIRELLAEHGPVAMVGDGVNDAPALATASVGIAMGAAGSDTALETADVALMADDLGKLPYLIRLSRSALGIIRANIAFSLVVKAVFLALTLAGLANLWLAIFADTGAALLVISNSMRLLRFRDDDLPPPGAGADGSQR